MTTPVTIPVTPASYIPLGNGPLLVQAKLGAPVQVLLSTLQPAPGSQGFEIAPGTMVKVDSTDPVWASPTAPHAILTYVPITPVSSGGGGGGPVTQGGTWTVQPGNTPNTTPWKIDGSATTQPVSATALPLPAGAATAAKQPAPGTAGTASADVISVQGIAGATAVKTDSSATTQPVSGTITANAGTNMSTAALALETGGNLAHWPPPRPAQSRPVQISSAKSESIRQPQAQRMPLLSRRGRPSQASLVSIRRPREQPILFLCKRTPYLRHQRIQRVHQAHSLRT
jgi:hypothetical protein